MSALYLESRSVVLSLIVSIFSLALSGRLVRLTVVDENQELPPELRETQQQSQYLDKRVTFALDFVHTVKNVVTRKKQVVR